jgi:hypothetical protein
MMLSFAEAKVNLQGKYTRTKRKAAQWIGRRIKVSTQ